MRQRHHHDINLLFRNFDQRISCWHSSFRPMVFLVSCSAAKLKHSIPKVALWLVLISLNSDLTTNKQIFNLDTQSWHHQNWTRNITNTAVKYINWHQISTLFHPGYHQLWLVWGYELIMCSFELLIKLWGYHRSQHRTLSWPDKLSVSVSASVGAGRSSVWGLAPTIAMIYVE